MGTRGGPVRENRIRSKCLSAHAHRRFVVVSGLPGSGKSRLASQLAPVLGLAVIDKDEILERLFALKGAGDPAWRRTLSRESDLIFQQEAQASEGALLVSFWRVPGMSPATGTPTDWLSGLSARVVHLQCACPAEIAAARFSRRQRHRGHLDQTRSPREILESIQDLSRFGPLNVGSLVTVDTSAEVRLGEAAAAIEAAFRSAT